MWNKLALFLRLLAAIIFLQTLYFKFSGAPESVWIFTKLGVEPWGRFAAALSELVAAILLLIPATARLGALMGLGIISGALASHLFVLGIVIQDDGGLLFGLAVTTFVACAGLLVGGRKRTAGDPNRTDLASASQ
ncbi:MAG: DoxX family membrane protein [Planctomycetes bacterium]|nr:DoxX family membrane protein [Planctomycetota bacterium]MCB9910603.1 DoxX family membrane protein [Planctomycetota bacterium]HPF14911.1 DoxX family membrane protein [Planctomycetota bacterium]HRV80605.1 DoxX family membrane protein [Planctomycetota bacterium]